MTTSAWISTRYTRVIRQRHIDNYGRPYPNTVWTIPSSESSVTSERRMKLSKFSFKREPAWIIGIRVGLILSILLLLLLAIRSSRLAR